jgi:hypothetical protein
VGERNYAETGIVRPDDIVKRLRSEHRMALAPLHMSDAADEIERLQAEVTAIRAERDCAQIQAAHLARRLVAEARLHGGPP